MQMGCPTLLPGLLPDAGCPPSLHVRRVTIILAIVGQSVTLLYTLRKQTTNDILLLDWEKPHRVLSKDGGLGHK